MDFLFINCDVFWDFYGFYLLFGVDFFKFFFEFGDKVCFIFFSLFIVFMSIGFCRISGFFEFGFEFIVINVILLIFVDDVGVELFVEFYDDKFRLGVEGLDMSSRLSFVGRFEVFDD